MTRDLEDVLASIDGALSDPELPDAMRWSPDPASVTDAIEPIYTEDQGAGFPVFLARRGGIRYPPQSYCETFLAPPPRVANRPLVRGEVVQREEDRSLTIILEPDTGRLEAAFREALGRAATAVGAALDQFVPQILEDLRDPRGQVGPDPVTQPFERALWHKARQGTGPDRQVQHRPRPRRHVL